MNELERQYIEWRAKLSVVYDRFIQVASCVQGTTIASSAMRSSGD